MNEVVEFDVLPPAPQHREYSVLPPHYGDSEAVAQWLSLYTRHTLRAYQRELGAFLQFLSLHRVRSVRHVNIDHVRTFLAPLSDRKQDYAKRVLNSFYRWLMEVGYVNANPIVATSRRTLRRQARTDKFLHPSDVTFLIKAMHELDGHLRNYASRRWIFWLLFHTGARREEIAGNIPRKEMEGLIGQRLPSGVRGPMLMSDFMRKPMPTSAQATEGWELRIVGKGDKERIIPVSPELMGELVRYRRYLRMPDALPRRSDTTPVVCGDDKYALSPQGIYANLKAITSAMADLLQDKPECERLVEDLRRVTPHWLRHTYVTALIATGAKLESVKDLVGHVSLDTTLGYKGRNEEEMVEAVNKLGKLVSIWDAPPAVKPAED